MVISLRYFVKLATVNLHRRLLDTNQEATPPGSDTKVYDSCTSATHFNTFVVIILVVSCCGLLCALVLSLIGRWLAAPGVKKRDLSQIPEAVYGSGLKIPATECPICLGEFMEGEKVRVLPECEHGFHVKCIDRWLVSHESCPNCRHSLLEEPSNSQQGSQP